MTDRNVGSERVIMAMVALVLLAASLFPLALTGEGAVPLPKLDAYIAGTVVNGSAGMKVQIMITVDDDPSTPGGVTTKYFNGTTDGTGSFNMTVDSNSTTNEYKFMGKYTAIIFSTYYLGLTKGTYQLPVWIGSGETYHIPSGELEAYPEDIGNLTVRILNASSGSPLQGTTVTINPTYTSNPPPFELAKLTDSKGEAKWDDVRCLNTSVEAKNLHFQDLSTTEVRNFVTVAKGGTTEVTFDLREDPWPFSTDPRDGAVDVNVSEPLVIDFGRVMDRASITDPSNYLLTGNGGSSLSITLVPAVDDRSVDIQMDEPLAYDTNHALRLDTTLLTDGGGKPLWRAMEVKFRTELPPGSVSGRLVDTISGQAAWGARLLLSDQRLTANETGRFLFPIVPKGTYRLEVLDSYLYNATSVPGIVVAKGSSVDLGTIEVGPKSWGSLEVTVISEAGNVPGATVKVLSSLLDEDEMVLTTGPDGKVLFPRVRSGNVNLRGSAPRHSTIIDIAIVKAGASNQFTLRLKEDELPVTVTPTIPLGDGLVDPDSDLVIHVPEEIKFQSLDVELWKLSGTGERDVQMELAAPTKGSEALTYVVNIPGKLPMETGFELTIDDTLQALDDLEQLLWRDIVYIFRTPDHPLAYVSGTILLEGTPYKGLTLTLGPFSGVTDELGRFNITVDLSSHTEVHTLRANLTGMGYQDLSRELTVNAGSYMELGANVLYLLPGWYSVSPGPGETGVEPGTNITFTFGRSVMDPGDGWGKLLKVILSGSSAPVAGSYHIGPENMTVTIDPTSDLAEGSTYIVEVSDRLLLRSGGPVLPVGNRTTFTVRPPSLIITLEEPVSSALSSLPLDGIIKLAFSSRVNTTLLEASLQFTPQPTGLVYEWPSSSELWISALYRTGQTFDLLLPVGQYGTGGEPLRQPFSLDITVGQSYSRTHAPESFQMVPETNWVKGTMVRVTGSSLDSVGYEVSIIIKKGGSEVAHRTTVAPDGSFNLTFSPPSATGEYQVLLTIAIPGGPVAYEDTFEVKVKSERGENGGDGLDPVMIAISAVLILVILAIVIGGLLFMRAQRRKLSDRPEIEYSDVDADWSEE